MRRLVCVSIGARRSINQPSDRGEPLADADVDTDPATVRI
jgi:hypothetical protein